MPIVKMDTPKSFPEAAVSIELHHVKSLSRTNCIKPWLQGFEGPISFFIFQFGRVLAAFWPFGSCLGPRFARKLTKTCLNVRAMSPQQIIYVGLKGTWKLLNKPPRIDLSYGGKLQSRRPQNLFPSTVFAAGSASEVWMALLFN